MPNRHAKPDPDQLRLLLTREERLVVLECVDPIKANVTKRQWTTLSNLLMQIEFCGGAGSSFARVEVLAARMRIEKRSVRRIRRVAEKAGMLTVVERFSQTSETQRSNQWLVQWDQLRSYCDQGKLAACLARLEDRQSPRTSQPRTDDQDTQQESQQEPCPTSPGQAELQTASQKMSSPPDPKSSPPDSESPPPDPGSPLIESLQIPQESPESKVDPVGQAPSNSEQSHEAQGGRELRRVDRKNHLPRGAAERVDWGQAAACAQQIARKISKPQGSNRLTAANREFALKVAALSQQYGERWLNDAIEGVRQVRPRKVWAYLWSCLEDGAKQQRRHFRRDLSQLRPPDEMLRPPDRSEPQQSDLSERLCGAGEGGRRIAEGGMV